MSEALWLLVILILVLCDIKDGRFIIRLVLYDTETLPPAGFMAITKVALQLGHGCSAKC